MATPLNIELLRDQGFTIDEDVGPNDLVIAVRADDEEALDAAVAAVDRELAAKPSAGPTRAGGHPLDRRRRRDQSGLAVDPG